MTRLMRLLPALLVSLVTRFLSGTGLAAGDRAARWLMWHSSSGGVGSANLHGLRLSLDLNDNLQREVFYLGDYERSLHRLLRAELASGDVVADVGANIGLHALQLALHLQHTDLAGTVYAFEPAPDARERLRASMEENRLANVVIVPIALSDRKGTANLRSATGWHPSDLGVRSLYAEGDVQWEVPLDTFDAWAAGQRLERLDIVKIDVEGGEVHVLCGMRATLDRLRPRLIVVEVVPELLLKAGSTIADIKEIFDGLGYVADGPDVDQIAKGSTGPLWPNLVMRAAGSAR